MLEKQFDKRFFKTKFDNFCSGMKTKVSFLVLTSIPSTKSKTRLNVPALLWEWNVGFDRFNSIRRREGGDPPSCFSCLDLRPRLDPMDSALKRRRRRSEEERRPRKKINKHEVRERKSFSEI